MSKEDPKSKLMPVWVPARALTWEQTNAELKKIQRQMVIIHDLPKLNGENPNVYLHDALEGLRQRAIALNWARIEMNEKAVKKVR